MLLLLFGAQRSLARPTASFSATVPQRVGTASAEVLWKGVEWAHLAWGSAIEGHGYALHRILGDLRDTVTRRLARRSLTPNTNTPMAGSSGPLKVQ